MQKTTLLTVLSASYLVLWSPAILADSIETTAANNVRFVGQTEYAGFCQAVVEDDVKVLKKNASRQVGRLASSQEAVISLVMADDGLRCNGDNLVTFAERRGARTVHDFLQARLVYE
ncbi:DUF3718 domain-containing protein [Alteromonas ponticola]|uniref:DUF3718 domain-containing protein n=1 Tax=Alteromonas ponticola TaxID=2720613 RepID=A0ABX1QZN3_9ALTE|nr:DUF3718 domain-containing protein [Alteromonas ponticola]NMH58656.1 DUF3718 domain-containing protein [Alteromonas ponticola]